MNIIERYITACFRPGQYRKLIEDKKHSIWYYLLLLAVILTLIENAIPFLAWDASVGGLKNLLTNTLPSFSIEKGEMKCEQKLFFSIGQICTVKVDTSEEAYDEQDVENEAYAFYFSKTNLVIKNSGVAREVDYKQFGDMKIDNSTLVSLLPIFRISMGISFVLLCLSTLAQYLFMALFYTILCMGMVKDPGGDRLPFKVTFDIAIYAKTLFALISAVGYALGYPMSSVIVILITVSCTIYYIFRGQASVLKIEWKK